MRRRQENWLLVLVFTLSVVYCGSPLLQAEEATTPSTRTSEHNSPAILAEGTRWATPVFVRDSGKPGPTVLILGGVHGNEPAGARAAEQIRHWPIAQGKLVVVPRVNRPGLNLNTRYLPGVETAERDLNRNFPKAAEGSQPRGELATALMQLVADVEPDWVLDLHEGFEFHISHDPPEGKKKSVGSSLIYQSSEAVTPIAARMHAAVNKMVSSADRKFDKIDTGPVDSGFVAACNRIGIGGMILETTYKDQPLSLRTRQHRTMVSEFLLSLDMLDESATTVLVAPETEARLKIAVYDGAGTGGSGVTTLTKIIDAHPDMCVHHVGPADIQPGVLKPFDVVIFPGGSGSRQAGAIGKGGAAVQEFVKEGGGYIGICAGAYLASSHYKWSLNLLNAKVFTGAREIEGVGTKQMWYRGASSEQQMELTDAGRELFEEVNQYVQGDDVDGDLFAVRYHNGPIMSPGDDPDLPAYEALAHFRTEIVRYPPQKGTMVDTPAIIRGDYGRGHALAISPHPETSKHLQPIIVQSILWAAGKVETEAAAP